MTNKFFQLATLLFVSALSTETFAKTIKFTVQDSPPFGFTEGTEVKGGAAEVMKKVCEKLKWTCEMNVVPQKRGLALAESGENDGIWAIIQIPEREKYLTHSVPTWTSKLSYMGIKGTTAPVTKSEDLKGFTIAGVRGSAAFKKAEELKAKMPDVKLVETNSYPEGFKALFENSFGAKGIIVSYEEVGAYVAKQNKFDKLTTILPIEQVQFRVGFSKKADPQLVKDFDRTLEEMRKSGELKAALAKYGMNE